MQNIYKYKWLKLGIKNRLEILNSGQKKMKMNINRNKKRRLKKEILKHKIKILKRKNIQK